jgi:hypothetical protein
LSRYGLTPSEARFQLRRLRRPAVLAAELLQQMRDWIGATHELRVYLRDTSAPIHSQTGIAVHRDALEDLLLYDPAEGGESRQAFLSSALRRLESGQHAYTVAEGGRLRCSAWLDEQPGPHLENVGSLAGFALPAASAVIHDFRAFGASAGAPPATHILRAVLADVAALPGVRNTVLTTRGEDQTLAHAAQRLGFKLSSTLLRVVRLGRAGWVGVHAGSGLLPRRPTAVDSAASSEAPKRAAVEEVEAAGAV